MAERDTVLSVNNLVINFKTDNGLVQAVRDVSFDLKQGETLCIVGESGSGKSVTSKAIMGILANNAIIANGNIIYRGENLLEVSEEEFYKIRGHKIGMIFQDPLSSLNPIVKIGKQITEATLINSDKLKLMYNDIISDDLIRYKNTLAKMNIQIDSEKKKLDSYIASLGEKGKLTEADKAEIKEKQAAFKTFVQSTRAEYMNQARTLKAVLDQKSREAKAQVKEYKAKVTAEHKAKESAIRERLRTASGPEKEKLQKELEEEKLSFMNRLSITKAEARRRALEIMREVGIPEPEKRFEQYPFEFSGGMRQRIVIAIALTVSPEILICDEPTTALDVTIQAQILELMQELQKKLGMAVILVTHDLGVIADMCDNIVVMYGGRICERGTADEIFYNPCHEYTKGLLRSIPAAGASKERLIPISGTPINMLNLPKGCAFCPRCDAAMKICLDEQPEEIVINENHKASCWCNIRDGKGMREEA